MHRITENGRMDKEWMGNTRLDQGSFNNYVEIFLPFFEYLPTPTYLDVDISYPERGQRYIVLII